MAIFISYSHTDAPFVDKLGALLFKEQMPVWLDRWELNVGDSLIRRIEEAINDAAAVIFVLSRASVESNWCRKELSAGLVRELEEKKVIVLPLLLEDCAVPLFLREKKYADFRTDFDTGFRDIVNALARVTSDTQGRVEGEPGTFIDWSSDWSVDDKGQVSVELVIVEHGAKFPFTLVSMVKIALNDRASERHLDLVKAGMEPFARQLVLACLTDCPLCDDLYVYLDDASPVVREFGMGDPKIGVEFRATAVCRRLGLDTGKDIVLNLGNELRGVAAQSHRVLTPLTRPEKREQLRQIMKKYRPDFPG
jgi:hypothetical protein